MLMKEKETGVASPSAIPIASENGVIDGADMTGDYETVRRDKDMPKETREEREEQVGWEKVCEEERERRLEEAKDAAMGKRHKITRDRECDNGEKAALAVASAKHDDLIDLSSQLLDQALYRSRIAAEIGVEDEWLEDKDAEEADDPFGLESLKELLAERASRPDSYLGSYYTFLNEE